MAQTFLLANPTDAPAAAALGLPCCFLCYRAAPSGALQRTPLPAVRGGLLGLTDLSALQSAGLPRLLQEVQSECRRRDYAGVLLSSLPEPSQQALCADLCARLEQARLTVFLPQALAGYSAAAPLLLPGRLSGGRLEEMLEAYAAQWGKERVCITLRPCRHRFPIPFQTPDGSPLSADALRSLRQQQDIAACFSPELCTNYLLLPPSPPEQPWQLVLFDDVSSAAQRLQRMAEWGARACFLPYAEWGSDAAAILSGTD